MADFALDVLATISDFNAAHRTSINMRVGFHTGRVVAGVIGSNKFCYVRKETPVFWGGWVFCGF